MPEFSGLRIKFYKKSVQVFWTLFYCFMFYSGTQALRHSGTRLFIRPDQQSVRIAFSDVRQVLLGFDAGLEIPDPNLVKRGVENDGSVKVLKLFFEVIQGFFGAFAVAGIDLDFVLVVDGDRGIDPALFLK